METAYALAFSTGLLGGFGHCIGMCGPLVATYTLHSKRMGGFETRPYIRGVIPHLLYNTGRITTYMFVGAAMGLTGSFVNIAGRLSGLQNVVAILAGLLMIFMGVGISGIAGGITRLEKHNSLVLKLAKNILQGESLWRYFPLGALFGFLPCGLLYTVFMAAAGTGDLLSGMLTLFFFGIGTLPALLLFGTVSAFLSHKLRGWVYKAAGVTVIVMGIYFIFRGVNLYAKV